MTVLLLELNEINFEQVLRYADRGALPVLADLVKRHGLCRTTSEQRYDELEPWIQWVTAHTGLTLAEHGIYRLGDVNRRSLDQIWEVLEQQGITVGAISPMNASNRCVNPAFFMPDPWTTSPITGDRLARLYPPVVAAVNGNADARMSPAIALRLVAGLVSNALPRSYAGYVADVAGVVRGQSWRKAMLLDRLLADVFVREVKAHRPGFASLFLNAGAHIQHHYLYNSAVYDGGLRNPDWYISPSSDPVFDVYALYDAIVGKIRQLFPGHRLMLATGLHQDPHGKLTMYWRLRQHSAFLIKSGISFVRVEPRMSRDFVIFCRDTDEAEVAERRLLSLTAESGEPLFAVDNRGDSLFVELIWSADIPADFVYLCDGAKIRGLRDDVAFVAIKNGEHNGVGYFIDTGRNSSDVMSFPLSELPVHIAHACGARWKQAATETTSDDLAPVA